MTDASYKQAWVKVGLLCIAGVVVSAGCGPKNYKKEADDKVYAIIDQKWDEGFGPKVNYKISDTAPSANALQIDKAIPASGVLTLPQAMALATAHNRDYQSQKETLYTTALDLRLVRHAYETQLFGGGSALYSDNGQDEAVEVEANIGFNRLLASGTQIGTRIATAWADILTGTGRSGLASVFTATITQPLFRGSDPAIVLERLTQAERNTLYQIRAFNRFRKSFAVSVATQYFQALELYDVILNTRDYYEALSVLHAKVVKLSGVGRVPKLEVDRLRQEMLRARDELILAEKEYDRFLDQFKITLALRTTTAFQLDTRVLAALRNQGIPDSELSIDEAVEAALRGRLDMANSADAVLDAQRAVYVAADSLRADLRLEGGLEAGTDGYRVARAGPILDLPLDRVPEQNAYRKALIALDQRRRDYDLAADTVRLEVRQAHRKLLETAERYQVLSESLELATQRLKRTSSLLEYGRASSRRVLAAQQDYNDTRNALTDALADYAIATLEFYRDAGVLRVRPDGMWERGPQDLPVVRNGVAANGSDR